MRQRDGAWWEKEINNNNKITPAGWSEAEGALSMRLQAGRGWGVLSQMPVSAEPLGLAGESHPHQIWAPAAEPEPTGGAFKSCFPRCLVGFLGGTSLGFQSQVFWGWSLRHKS